MSKLLGAIAGLGAIGGGAYYVSNAVAPDIDTPPYLAAGELTSVYASLSQMPLPTPLAKLDSSNNPELAAFAEVQIVAEPVQNQKLSWSLVVDGDRYVTASATFKPVGGQTSVDVRAVLENSPFTQSGHLHPFDSKVVESAIDLALTEYIASVIEKRPMKSLRSMERVFEAKLGFAQDQKSAMRQRLQAAYVAAQAPLIVRAMERSGASSEDIARAMDDASSANDYDPDHNRRGRNYDPRDTMREGASPTMSARPMVDVGNGR